MKRPQNDWFTALLAGFGWQQHTRVEKGEWCEMAEAEELKSWSFAFFAYIEEEKCCKREISEHQSSTVAEGRDATAQWAAHERVGHKSCAVLSCCSSWPIILNGHFARLQSDQNVFCFFQWVCNRKELLTSWSLCTCMASIPLISEKWNEMEKNEEEKSGAVWRVGQFYAPETWGI